jgi:hypothetical protein
MRFAFFGRCLLAATLLHLPLASSPVSAFDVTDKALELVASLNLNSDAMTVGNLGATDLQPSLIAALTPAHVDVADPPKKGDARAPTRFTHPCIPITREELDTIKANLDKEPWKSGFAMLANDARSQLTYAVRGPFEEVKRNPYLRLNEWRDDMIAVYHLARMWYFTGNSAYAQKSHDILLAWAKNHKRFGGHESGLDLGDFAVCYGGGASILRGTWPGWTAADTATVKEYFLNVLWPASGAHVDAIGPANKGSLCMAAGIAIATFCDDTAKFDHIINLYRSFPSSGLSNSLPTGEMGETGRDAGHSYGDLLARAFVAEVAWKQGIDLYSELDNRLLACGEYYARNTMASDTQPAPFVPFGTIDYHYWVNQNGPYTGNRAAMYLIQNAYKNRKKIPTPWIDRKLEEQHLDNTNFMYAKTADSSTATPLPPVVYPPVSLASSGLSLITLGTQTAGRGASYASNGVWTVSGLGNGGWTKTTDDGQFVFKKMTGDCAMLAQVTSLAPADCDKRRAGLMIRDTLTADAPQRGWVAILSGDTPRVEAYMNGWTETWGGSNWAKRSQPLVVGLPYWLKIERRGKLITSASSQDGTSWAPVCCSYYDNLPPTLYIGLFVSSGMPTPSTGTFANVAFTGGTGGLVKTPVAPAALFAIGSGKDITLRWLPSFGATAYDLYRSTTSGSGYTLIASDLGTTKTSYVDTTAIQGTTYHYVVRAKNTVGTSTNSPQFSAALLSTASVNVAIDGIATASFNNESETEGPAKSFDGNPGSKWFGHKSPTGWLQYDLGAGKERVIRRYTVTGTDVPERSPKNWAFQASIDGTSWVTLDTQNNQAFPYRMKMNTYDIRNTASYRFYRLDIAATNGAKGVAIGEFGLWADGGRTVRNGR